MDEQIGSDQPQSRVKKGSSTLIYVAIVIVVLLIAGFYFYTQKGPFPPTDHEANTTADREAQFTEQAPSQAPGPGTEIEDKQPSQKPGLRQEDPTVSDVDSFQKNGTQTESPTPTASKDIPSSIRQRLSAEGNPKRLVDEINSFYAYLDQQPYMQNLALKESSKVYFSNLLQKLANNPPVVHRETDDLITLLQNTSHFFRIFGKDNINILKEILEREKNSFEHILKAFYGLTYLPEYLKKEYSLSIPPDVRTDYAAFFLNTIGGRLYLFRRDPTTRMVVSYYAIITIDRANSEGNGGHGIDIRPAILSLIEELENGGDRLRLKDEYLDVLYDLQEKYN